MDTTIDDVEQMYPHLVDEIDHEIAEQDYAKDV